MKAILITFFCFLGFNFGLAQFGGGASTYGNQSGSTSEAQELAKRNISKDNLPSNPNTMFFDAAVMINVKADTYVAVFGISQEGENIQSCNDKMNETIRKFRADLNKLSAKESDIYVDFIAQNRIYGYDVQGNVAKEKIIGFELKKNVSIRFTNKDLLESLIAVAAKINIFDLIKVDYIVSNTEAIQKRLIQEATRIVKSKAQSSSQLLGIKLGSPIQIIAEKYSAYYPSEQYSSYTAFEGENIETSYYRQNFTIQGARKNRTFYFKPLDAKLFDKVINPVITEPVVQFTLYLKVVYSKATGTPSKK